MTLSTDLWQASRELAQACLAHPFVQGIATGKLPIQAFQFYVGQDAYFLQAFARGYSVAAARSPDWEGFQAFHELAGGVLEELRLHHEYAHRWGVNLGAVTPSPATRRYTDFLLATAWSQEVGVTAAALAPCMRLYAYLGQRLAEQGPAADSAYREWIQTYSSPEFDALARRLEGLVDRYGRDDDLTRSAYAYAMACELDFFQAAWEGGKS
ncbi:TenA family protein [Litorilinea aerophila]|uniref:TenA family protein n=1 Tax=Litorilinea aerophila TaxID=1204385 RepID=A0A540VFZ6_9CHLR|nr:TenA family protein [Litorilinea aerophila]MCC9076693.1 TenA family protein [Litorilinea aerophila]OUC09699.1 TenA family transcriptional regulator [Litorilinea aerophila]